MCKYGWIKLPILENIPKLPKIYQLFAFEWWLALYHQKKRDDQKQNGSHWGDFESFTKSIHRNLTHYFMMAHYSLPALKKSKGSIVNIGSKTSFTGQGGTSAYAAANGGRNALTREWAVELLPFSIRVNSIIVAECYTPLYQKWIKSFPNPEGKLKEIESKIPLENRMTTTKEIGSAVAFLLSKKSSHTTGQLLFVDGGYTHLDRSL